MFDRIRRFIAGPVFVEDEEKTRLAALLNMILWLALALELLSSILAPFVSHDPRPTWGINAVLALLQLGMLWAIWRGYVVPVSIILGSGLWLVVLGITVGYSGVSGPGPVLFLVVITITSLLSGGHAGLFFGVLSMIAVLVVSHAEAQGWLRVDPRVITREAMATTLMAAFFFNAVLIFITARSLRQTLRRARQNEQAQREANRALEALRVSLEERVAQRTAEIERQASYLQAAAEIGRAATILDPAILLEQAVDSISRHFDLEHVALFLREEAGADLELRAAQGKSSQPLAMGLRVPIRRDSLLGGCATTSEMRVWRQEWGMAEADAMVLLPETRVAAVLPLVARQQLVGVLCVQSTETEALGEPVLRALSTLADQIAVGLDNATLLASSQAALEAEKRAYGELERAAWLQLLQARKISGYSYANKQLVPLIEPPSETEAMVSIPIKIRGQTVGVVELAKDTPAAQWTPAEQGLLEMLTEQLGAALDSARLYEETQRRAARERLAGEITAHMRESLDLERILQSVVREISAELGVETEIWLGEAALRLEQS